MTRENSIFFKINFLIIFFQKITLWFIKEITLCKYIYLNTKNFDPKKLLIIDNDRLNSKLKNGLFL